MQDYPYITTNNLFQRQYYNYAACDDAFFDSYEASRVIEDPCCDALNGLRSVCLDDLNVYYKNEPDVLVLRFELDKLILALLDGRCDDELQEKANKIVKTFEVRKRLYHSYNERMKPFDERDFEDVNLYVLFACMNVLVYRNTEDLKYLNALLKVDDILLSVKELYQIQNEMIPLIPYCVSMEKEFVSSLLGEEP